MTLQGLVSGSKPLSEEEERTARKFVLEGKLNGLELSQTEQQNFYEILGQIGQERAKFRGKLEVSSSNVCLNIMYYHFILPFKNNHFSSSLLLTLIDSELDYSFSDQLNKLQNDISTFPYD